MVIVRGGGHIEYWDSLYKVYFKIYTFESVMLKSLFHKTNLKNCCFFQSESPAQVSLFMISFLILYVTTYNIGPEAWELLWLFYDNMCTYV